MMVYALINEGKVDGKPTVGLEPLNGNDYQKIEVEDVAPDEGLYMTQGRALVSGRRVKLDHVPKQMKAWSEGVIPDYRTSHGFICVTDKFKAVVEAIEPGVHQFIPFEVVDPNKSHIADLWFMVVCNRLDSVDRENTTLVLRNGRMWCPAKDLVRRREDIPAGIDPNAPSKLYFNISQIGSHHIWFDKHFGQENPIVSDIFVDALKKAKVTGVSFGGRMAV